MGGGRFLFNEHHDSASYSLTVSYLSTCNSLAGILALIRIPRRSRVGKHGRLWRVALREHQLRRKMAPTDVKTVPVTRMHAMAVARARSCSRHLGGGGSVLNSVHSNSRSTLRFTVLRPRSINLELLYYTANNAKYSTGLPIYRQMLAYCHVLCTCVNNV